MTGKIDLGGSWVDLELWGGSWVDLEIWAGSWVDLGRQITWQLVEPHLCTLLYLVAACGTMTRTG